MQSERGDRSSLAMPLCLRLACQGLGEREFVKSVIEDEGVKGMS